MYLDISVKIFRGRNMALKQCEECSERVSDKARFCPHCGVSISKKKEFVFKFRWIIYFAVILFLLWRITVNETDEERNFIETVFEPVEYIYDGELQLEEDYYRYFKLELNQDTYVTIDYTIKSGPNMDVYFLSEDAFYIWERIIKENIDEPFYYDTELSTFNTSKSSKTINVPKGTYFVVLDNTDNGPTYPPMNLENDFVTVDLTITTKR
jgi:hypothetical protein